MIEGPRGLREGEMASLRELTDVVFRPNMPEQYPHLINIENLDNLRVCLDNGKCVSHVGMLERHASLFGCLIQVCCIGGVATHPAYRGRGLASACFDDAVRKAWADGVDVMIVSGSRNLYSMRGCLHVGADAAFALTPESAAALPAPTAEVTVEPLRKEDLSLVTECYRREPVRFIRPLEDYQYPLNGGMVMNRFSDFLVVREGRAFRGYVILQRPHDLELRPLPERRTGLAEFAGDRRALLSALPQIVRQHELVELHWQVLRHDHDFRALCEDAGLTPKPRHSSGTVKVTNFPQLMERMRPRFEELLGRRAARLLAFRQNGEEYCFRFGEEELIADRDTATRLLFGTVEGSETAALEGQGKLAEILRTIFPLPCLWYGVNYV